MDTLISRVTSFLYIECRWFWTATWLLFHKTSPLSYWWETNLFFLPWILKVLRWLWPNNNNCSGAMTLEGKWLNRGIHKEYLISGYLCFFVCPNFRTEKLSSALKNAKSRRMYQLPDPDVCFGLILLLFWVETPCTDPISALHEQEGLVGGLKGLPWSPASSLPWRIRRDRPQNVVLSMLVCSWISWICSSKVLVPPKDPFSDNPMWSVHGIYLGQCLICKLKSVFSYRFM